MVEHHFNAVIVACRRVKAAGGDQHEALFFNIVAIVMASAAHSVSSLLHKGQHHRKLTVDKVFKRAGNAKVIKRKAVYYRIRPYYAFQYLRHIVLDYAASRSRFPARKAALAASDIHLTDVKSANFVVRIMIQSRKKSFRKLHRVASFSLRTSVYHKNIHFSSSVSIDMQLFAHSISIFLYITPYISVIRQYFSAPSAAAALL